MTAEKLGQKLLQWGADDWNQGPVTTQRVQKSKKKNKGLKRPVWQREVKAYHAGKGKGKGGHTSVEPPAVPDLPLFPSAPWWNPPPTEEKVGDESDKKDEKKQE